MSDEMTDETEAVELPGPVAASPGWYANPIGEGLRFWDGDGWTRQFLPVQGPDRREFLWGLALGFGVTGGAVGVLSIPIAAFYFPLGFGAAGVALSIAAVTERRGSSAPWYSIIAVIASIAALALGISAYSDFKDASSQAQNAIDRFSP